MLLTLDFRSGVPIYVQIIDQIKHLVATGVLQPDDQLPTVRQLATELRVNFNTIARAYRLLDEEGLISTQQGRGTYIVGPASGESSQRLRGEALDWLTRHYLNQAARLNYAPEEVRPVVTQYLDEWQNHGSPPESEPDNI